MENGTVVKLKSGGPNMTVNGQDVSDLVDPKLKCSWFDANNKLSTASFRAEALEAVDLDDDGTSV